jgi:hypothetical protein
LRPEARKAIEARDLRVLYDLGFHPYVGRISADNWHGSST